MSLLLIKLLIGGAVMFGALGVFGFLCALKSGDKKLNVFKTHYQLTLIGVSVFAVCFSYVIVGHKRSNDHLKEVCIQNGITDPAKIESIMFLKYAKH